MTGSFPQFSQCSIYLGSGRVENHSHPATEIIYLRSGKMDVNINGKIFSPAAGDLLIIPPETVHDQECCGKVWNYFVVFVCEPELFNTASRIIQVKNERWPGQIMELLYRVCLRRRYELCNGILFTLLTNINSFENMADEFRNFHPATRKALHYLQENFGEELNIADIAKFCGITPGYLRAVFDMDLHLSPMEYLQDLRMSQARQLLLIPYYSIAEVANRCGYSNANYFSRLFRKIHHCSPSGYKDIVKSRKDTSIRL